MAPADSLRLGGAGRHEEVFRSLAGLYADLYWKDGSQEFAEKGFAAATEGRAYAFRETSGELARVRPRHLNSNAERQTLLAGLLAQLERGARTPGEEKPRLLAELSDKHIPVDAVDYVILTHVHLDHAGGAGLLMQQLPNARAVIHPRGVRHMVDPSALIAGATAVYGADDPARAVARLRAQAAARTTGES